MSRGPGPKPGGTGTLFAPVLTDDSFWDLEKRGKKALLELFLGFAKWAWSPMCMSVETTRGEQPQERTVVFLG